MKLVRFSVNNFRGIQGGLEQNTVVLDSVNTIFIFGQNNVGKSSFLKAYSAYYKNEVVAADLTHVADDEDALPVEIELWVQVDEDADKEKINKASNGKYDSLKSNYLDDGLLRVKRVWHKAGKGTEDYTCDLSGDWVKKSYGGIGLDGVFQSLLPKPLFIHAMPKEEEVKSVVNDILKEIASTGLSDKDSEDLKAARATIKKLQDKIYNRDLIDEYQNEVNESFGKLFGSYELEIDEGVSKAKFTHDKLGKDFDIAFKDKASGQATKYEHMGHGAVRMAIFLLMLMRDKLKGANLSRKDYLVLFEEPELFLHPVLTKKLRQLVYEVSASDMPFQVLCASHSPQMIDITKDHTSLVRMVKSDGNTLMYQVLREDLKNGEQTTDEKVKQTVHEILRFNPYVCESFYADEVLLVEGDTEAIMARAYLEEKTSDKEIFIVNCGTCNNIPFYQKIFAKFKIPYSVICDTDHIDKKDAEKNRTGWDGKFEEPKFASHIQKTISEQFAKDKATGIAKKFFVCEHTFEPFHLAQPEPFKFEESEGGKAVSANNYWEKINSHRDEDGFSAVPIIKYLEAIVG